MMLLVTGGTGFIGSNLIAKLNELGRSDIIICDDVADSKWLNITKNNFADIIPPSKFYNLSISILKGMKIETIFHFGATTDTMDKNANAIMENNFHKSSWLLDWSTQQSIPFIYASSAATYGNGGNGFSDSAEDIKKLRPMNMYAFSKHVFDTMLLHRVANNIQIPPQWVGLKFFNVYGPNENHKGPMKSIIAQKFQQVKEGFTVNLFKSYRPDILDGEQKRDFVYVNDAVDVTLWFFQRPNISGIFNVGTGEARSFNDVIRIMFRALQLPPMISYFEMPKELRSQYQYHTQANIEKLRKVGYDKEFTKLENGISEYMKHLSTLTPEES